MEVTDRHDQHQREKKALALLHHIVTVVPAARQFLLIIHVIKSSAVWTAVRKQGVFTYAAAVGALDAAILSCRKDKGIEHAGIELRLLVHQFPMHVIFFR